MQNRDSRLPMVVRHHERKVDRMVVVSLSQ